MRAAVLQVVRCFEDDDIVHVSGKVSARSSSSGAAQPGPKLTACALS